MMGLKQTAVLCIGLTVLCGCTTIKRLAPPGVIKYEDLAKDIPPSPEIQARIKDRREEQPPKFPVLSRQPSEIPDPIDGIERSSQINELLYRREELSAASEQDRLAIEAEREAAIEELERERDALAESVAIERQKAERERRTRPQ